MWERFGAHGDLQAVFDADPPQEVLDEMDDIGDVLGADMDGHGYLNALRARRGSRSISDASGLWSRSVSRYTNGMRRRRAADEDSTTVDGTGH